MRWAYGERRVDLDLDLDWAGLAVDLGSVMRDMYDPARVVEELAQGRILLELGEVLDELGQQGGVLEDDSDRVIRRAAVAGVVLDKLGGSLAPE